LRNRYHTNPEHKRKQLEYSMRAIHARRARKQKQGGSYTAQEWRDLCALYGHVCLCCGEAARLTPDHVVPIAKGGSNDISNIQPLCLPCNLRKATKTTDYRPTYPPFP
jgi:5-methylcytosine-specific restriction endonuclease McrA